MCLTVTILGVVHLLVEEINDTFQKTEAVVVLSDSVAACLKVAIFLKNRSRLMKCIQFFGDPRFAPKNNIEERIMGECLLVKYNIQKPVKWVAVNCNEYDTVETEHVFQSLKKCILLHNGILDFVAEFENCFSLCVFSQIAGTAIGLSFCCIGLAFNSFQGINGIMFIVCYLALGVQLFFYCHYGTLLYEENKGLINAVYMSPWYIYNTKARQMLLIIMERSKLPLNITAGKVMNLTYSTFITTLKTSYSWITVLKNYN
ncbi:odorant receptor 10a-like [Zophobas morio]|uniref:odorant receptor 10a-like n=1 Tax=Zophobas morio TaxID=2755281 RepID=UPI003082C47F